MEDRLCWVCRESTYSQHTSTCPRCRNAMDFKTPDDCINLIEALAERIGRLEQRVKELSEGQ